MSDAQSKRLPIQWEVRYWMYSRSSELLLDDLDCLDRLVLALRFSG